MYCDVNKKSIKAIFLENQTQVGTSKANWGSSKKNSVNEIDVFFLIIK